MFDGRSYLVIGVGGGGDVVSAAILAHILRRMGLNIVVGSIVWERFTIDPTPGPIPLDSIIDCREISRYACMVNPSTYALRRGKRIVFQAVNVSRALGEEIAVVDVSGGVDSYWRGVMTILDYYGLDGVIGVDVGGDILAYGLEEELWSPLADALGLAVLNRFDESYLIVHSLGSDGELPLEYLLKRLSTIISKKGLVGIIGLTLNEKSLLEKILYYAYTEASKIQLLALQGYYGEYSIRRGSRKVMVNPYSLVSFILKPHIVYSESLIARVVDKTNSILEAKEKLNKLGVYTEYDLEEDLLKENIEPEYLSGDDILRIREYGRKRLKAELSSG